MTGKNSFIPASEGVDISAEVFGKYQHCTKRDGIWWADSDFADGAGGGKLKTGAMPAPHQDGADANRHADWVRNVTNGYQPPARTPAGIWIGLGMVAGVSISILLFVFGHGR